MRSSFSRNQSSLVGGAEDGDLNFFGGGSTTSSSSLSSCELCRSYTECIGSGSTSSGSGLILGRFSSKYASHFAFPNALRRSRKPLLANKPKYLSRHLIALSCVAGFYDFRLLTIVWKRFSSYVSSRPLDRSDS